MPGHSEVGAAGRLLQALTVRAAIAVGDYSREHGGRLAARLEALARRAAYSEASGSPASDDVRPTGVDPAADRALTDFLSEILSRRGPDIHDYLSAMIGYSPERPTTQRHSCGRRLFVFQMVPSWMVGGIRDLYVCERCGPAYSLPDGWAPPRDIEIRASQLRVELGEPVAAGGWYTACTQPIGGHREAPGELRPLSAGAAQLSVDVPASPTPGLRRFSAALVTSGECLIFQLPIPAPSRG